MTTKHSYRNYQIEFNPLTRNVTIFYGGTAIKTFFGAATFEHEALDMAKKYIDIRYSPTTIAK